MGLREAQLAMVGSIHAIQRAAQSSVIRRPISHEAGALHGPSHPRSSVKGYGPLASSLAWRSAARSLSAFCGSAPPVVTALRALPRPSLTCPYTEIIGVVQASLWLTRPRNVFSWGMAVSVGSVRSDLSWGTLAFWMSIVRDGSSVM